MHRQVCRVCGDRDRLVPLHCVIWVRRDLCQKCLGNLPIEELDPLVNEELKAAGPTLKPLPPMALYEALALSAAIQLALRHPKIPESIASIVRELIEDMQLTVFQFTPAVQEVVRRGSLVQYDVPVPK